MDDKVLNLSVKGCLIGQGNTAEIFEWGNDKILKLYRHGLPDHLCTHEFELTKYACEQLKIAPKPIEIVHIDNRIGGVYDRLYGKTMLKFMLTKPWCIKKYSKTLARLHKLIHQRVNIKTDTVKENLSRNIENVSLFSLSEKKLLNEYIQSLPDGNVLCHFDFHPDNIMISNNQHYVIDWMTACVGDPLSDVARTALILNYGEIPRVPHIVNVLIKFFQKRIFTIYLHEYMDITGASLANIQQWELPIAAARLCEWIPEGESKKLYEFVIDALDKLNKSTSLD